MIWKDIILTSAQCQNDFSTAVAVGGTDIFGGSSVIFGVFQQLVNPNYNQFTLANDIMLVSIDSASAATEAVLNFNSATPATGDQGTIMGFGLDASSSNPNTLQEVSYKLTLMIVINENQHHSIYFVSQHFPPVAFVGKSYRRLKR